MGKLTNEFVEECLDRQDGDVPQLILAIAEGANPTDALLEGLSREEMLDWLQQEFDGLLMHGFEPLLEDGGLETNNAEILLGYLEKTKAERSPGLQFEIEPDGDPEELGAEGKYYQGFDVTIRYEGVELGSCVLESEGQYVSGKWVTEPAQWPTLLQGLIPLPTVAVQSPQHQNQEIDRIEQLETGLGRSDKAAIYEAYDELRARQGGLGAVSIGQLAKESGVPVPRLQQFLLGEASQDRVDLHATTLLWVSPEDKAGATRVPGWPEPAITVTIREKLVTPAPPTGLDVITGEDTSLQDGQPKYYEIQTRSGSHYLLENGEPIARFNELEKAEAARTMYVAELAAMYERKADTYLQSLQQQQSLSGAQVPMDKSEIIKEYDRLVDGPAARKRLEKERPSLVAARDQAVTKLRREKVNQELAEKQHLQQARAARR